MSLRCFGNSLCLKGGSPGPFSVDRCLWAANHVGCWQMDESLWSWKRVAVETFKRNFAAKLRTETLTKKKRKRRKERKVRRVVRWLWMELFNPWMFSWSCLGSFVCWSTWLLVCPVTRHGFSMTSVTKQQLPDDFSWWRRPTNGLLHERTNLTDDWRTTTDPSFVRV